MVWVFGVLDFEVSKNICCVNFWIKSYEAQRRDLD